MIEIDKVKKFFSDNYYVSNDILDYYTLRGINLINESEVGKGQDIYAVCLDGPPGAGKSMYAKLYAKMVHELLNADVELISYQCDDSTSKIELFEDINVGAAVAGKSEKVNIPGVIARAILAANKGKKVILFIDEYDKSREQVDSLFLQFLQDGRINTNQFGDLEIEDKYKGNIHVLFCKNDFRTELTGPLTRRIRKINLKIIKPKDFMDLARRRYLNNKNRDIMIPIIELVSLIYESVYDSDDYTRKPATSEMFTAIEDIMFLNEANASSNIVYNVLIEDLFKNDDDRELFNSSLDSLNNGALKKILTALKGNEEKESIKTISEAIKNAFKAEAMKDIENLKKEIEKSGKELENKYKEKEQVLDKKIVEFEQYVKGVKEEFNSIISKKKTIVEEDDNSKLGNEFGKNFTYKSPLIRIGKNVFLPNIEWTEIATLETKNNKFNNKILMDEFIKDNVIVYENGYLKEEKINDLRIPFILVRSKNEDVLTFKVFIDKKYKDNKNIDFNEIISKLLYKIIVINDNKEYNLKIGDNNKKIRIEQLQNEQLEKLVKKVKA